MDTGYLVALSILRAGRSIHLLHHLLLVLGLLLGIVLLVLVSRNSEISHQSFHRLFSLRSIWLKLVERIVENLSVVREEFTHLLKVDLDDIVLSEQLTCAMDDVLENGLEDTLVDLSIL